MFLSYFFFYHYYRHNYQCGKANTTKEKLRLQYSTKAELPLTDESSSNELNVENPNAIDLGTNDQKENLMFNYNNCSKK